MILKVVDLFLDIDRSRLLMDMKRKFDVLILETLLALMAKVIFDLGLLVADSLGILERFLNALVTLLFTKCLQK